LGRKFGKFFSSLSRRNRTRERIYRANYQGESLGAPKLHRRKGERLVAMKAAAKKAAAKKAPAKKAAAKKATKKKK